jgi:hypothetical protein
MVTGLIEPTRGHVLLRGERMAADPTLFKRNLGYMPKQPDLYGFLTGWEFWNSPPRCAKLRRGFWGKGRGHASVPHPLSFRLWPSRCSPNRAGSWILAVAQPVVFPLTPAILGAAWFWNRKRLLQAREERELEKAQVFENAAPVAVQRLDL